MLVRIVRMTFAPDHVETFVEHFDETASQIRSFPGCTHLELWQDADTPAIFTTYSHWDDEKALETYRESGLFRDTWAKVKPLFADRPSAHSYTVSRSATAIRASQTRTDEGN